jgi:hypothetical protein
MSRSHAEIKAKDVLVKDIQHKIAKKKQEQTRAETRMKERE